MKTVKVQGGLGNQLFCTALAHSIVAVTGETVRLDIGGYGADRYGHRFLLAELATRMEGLVLTRHPLRGDRRVGAVMRRLAIGGHVGEGRPPSDLAALRRLAESGTYFDGYWQNEAFMADPDETRAHVRAFLDARAKPTEIHDLLIHYRSYKDEIRADRRGTPDSAFFRRALAAVESRVGAVAEIALVSDDPSLALERLGDLGPRVRPILGGDAWTDMALILGARNLIATNSSFSWWGGFCGDAAMVVYPTRGKFHHYPAPAHRFVCL
jgi:hypothetical protein